MTHPFLFLKWLEEQLHLHLGEHVTYTWFVMLVLILVAFLATRAIKLAPSGLQNLMEAILTGISNLIEETMGPKGMAYSRCSPPLRCLSWFPTSSR